MHDVVVMGGGPAGCHAASLLGRNGLDVHIFEEHTAIGEPVDCSGVIGAESFESLRLHVSPKLGEIRSLTLLSPSNLKVRFSPPTPLAYVVDRAAFDKGVAEQALASGAILHLGARVIGLERRDKGMDVVVREVRGDCKTIKTRMVILAGGPRYKFQEKLGMGTPRDFLRTAQTEVPIKGINDTYVLTGSKVAPGSFAWIIPFRKGGAQFARVGVSTRNVPVPFLEKILSKLSAEGRLADRCSPVRSWLIPISPIKKPYADRVLAVGDAAGQNKPVTGGGIYYSLLSAKSAAGAAVAAFERGDFSASSMGLLYQREWAKMLGREIKIGTFFRRLAERLTDEEIDDLFRIVQSDGVLASIRNKARFDWHRDVISFALRHPGLGRIFLKGLFRQ